MNERLKKMFEKDKRTSNLVLIVILLVITLISFNVIFESGNSQDTAIKETVSYSISKNIQDGIDEKLANIINKIDGIENVEVMVTYSTTEKIIPVYDTKEDINTTADGTKKTTEKTVAYENEGGTKMAIVESKEAAVATGAIIVAKGNITESIKSEIKSAVSMVTDVPLHKIQIFVNN